MNNFDIIEQKKTEISNLKKSFKKNYSVKNNQQKLEYKLVKKKSKTFRAICNDIKIITSWIESIKDDESLKIISNSINSPSIINAAMELGNISECYISTWAVTDAGILALKSLQDTGTKIKVLLDVTHSYKWTFSSGAFDLLKNCQFIFTDNHSKFQCFKFDNGKVLNIVGSFNLSNNPRYENMEITKSFDDYEFYSNFVDDVLSDKNNTQKQLFDV